MEIKPRKPGGFSTSDEQPHERPHRELSRRAAAEGIVLLENREHVLPLEEGSAIALYGRGATRTVKGGTGSGDVNEREDVSIYDGLKKAGFRILNEQWLSDYNREYDQKRTEWRDDLLSEVRNSERGMEGFFDAYAARPFPAPAGEEPEKEDCDIAIYCLSRTAGEAADRRNVPGDYYLTEKEEKFLDTLCRLYDRVIVVINTGSVMDLSFMDSHKNICGLIFMCQAGMEGGNALADVLSGRVSAGGHLTDTWCYDYEDYPGASDFSFINEDLATEKYEEGIYVGYRYFDSLGIPVRYGFGYGLTYSEFTFEAEESVYLDGVLSLPVNVTNIGDTPAREVLQVYVSPPQSGMEKEFRRLAGYKKTSVLPENDTEQLTVSFPLSSLSSYNTEESCYVLEKGIYGIWCGFSLDKSVLVGGFELSDDVVTRKVKALCVPENTLKEFTIPLEEREELNRKWLARLREEELPVIRIDPLSIKSSTAEYQKEDDIPEEAVRLTDALSEEKLISLLAGAFFDDEKEDVVGSSGLQVPGGAGDTSYKAIEDGIASIVTADGPAGLRIQERYVVNNGNVTPYPFVRTVEHGFFDVDGKKEEGEVFYQYCTAFPVGTLLASSWDPELVFEVGKAVAEEMEIFGVDLWLAPGMNIHRNPLCGRNFEYFSEDPYVSGTMAAAMTEGVQSVEGRGTVIKHFACNNAEDNRFFSNSVLSERALREIYLKGFEIAVTQSQPMAVMTSYNKINGIHSANNKDLVTGILRDEWGFKGIVMTDWTNTWFDDNCTASGCVLAGTDIAMPGNSKDLKDIREALSEGRITLNDIKKCVYRTVRAILRCRKDEEQDS